MSKPVPSDSKEQPKNLLDGWYASLSRRFGKVSAPEPIIYEFTNDRALLHQYYRLREVMYRKVFKTDKFQGTEDVHDKLSHILIARRGKLVIGGCRLTIREADEEFMLPMESTDFKLRDVFPNAPLATLRHGEISRFAVLDDDDENMDIMLTLSQLIIEKCIDSELGYIFLKSSLPMARNWRKVISTHCGQKEVRICTEVKVPEMPIHPEITWYITEVALSAARIVSVHSKFDSMIEPVVH